ncbi:Uncharacterised protein [uncultured archaeon]|nr:Uncharacterised protein [uncultured archaeon]
MLLTILNPYDAIAQSEETVQREANSIDNESCRKRGSIERFFGWLKLG